MKKDDFIKSLIFKHILIVNDYKEIIDMLDGDKDPCSLFLELLDSTLKADKNFFAIDDTITNKTLTILNYYRFNDDNKNYLSKTNEYISKINKVSRKIGLEKEEVINSYIEKQADLRCLEIDTKHELLYLLRNDMLIYQSLLEGSINQQSIYLIEEATTYFLNSCTEIYDDEVIVDNTCKLLTSKKSNSNKKENHLRKVLIKEMNNFKK